jgi:transposase
LKDAGATLVAMESTGVYWKPVYEALEHEFETIVVNARHIKNVPGRKTDVKDCEWISDLLRHGLIRPGFVPPRDIRELRELNRCRRKVAQVKAGERNRLIKVLETAGIKLAGVASDVFGVSGRAMIRALIEGEDTPKVPRLRRGRHGRTGTRHAAPQTRGPPPSPACPRLRTNRCSYLLPRSKRARFPLDVSGVPLTRCPAATKEQEPR